MDPFTAGGGAALGATVLAFMTKTKTGKEADTLGEEVVAKLRGKVSGWFEKLDQRRAAKAEKCILDAQRKVGERGGATAAADEAEVAQVVTEAADANGPSVQEMFANLLAAKFDADRAASAHPSFGAVLKEMGEGDAQVLAAMYPSFKKHYQGGRRDGAFTFEQIAGKDGDPKGVTVCAENLIRLGVLDRGDLLGNANKQAQAGFTPYGWLFAAICVGDLEPLAFPYPTPEQK